MGDGGDGGGGADDSLRVFWDFLSHVVVTEWDMDFRQIRANNFSQNVFKKALTCCLTWIQWKLA